MSQLQKSRQAAPLENGKGKSASLAFSNKSLLAGSFQKYDELCSLRKPDFQPGSLARVLKHCSTQVLYTLHAPLLTAEA